MSLTLLRRLPLLSSMSDSALTTLRGEYEWAWFQPGEPILRQGQAAGDFFVVAEGKVEVLLEGDHPTRLGLLGAGEFFGELPALTGEPSPVTVVARELTTVLRLTRDGLLHLMAHNSELNRTLVATLAGRVKEAGVRLHRTRLRERSLADHITRQAARTHAEWVGTGVWSQRVRAAIARGSGSIAPVLFVGEPGTGKELAAARVHYNSQRKDGPLIVLDAARWSAERFAESLRMAAHGSLLLKQAHLAPPEAAEAVARVLPGAVLHRGDRGDKARQTLPGAIPRILATAGATEEREPSALEETLLAEGFGVPIAPLRERREDVPHLIRHFLKKHGRAAEGEPITGEALRKLESYPFLAGNVRELERVVQQAVLLAGGSPIQAEHLRLEARVRPAGRIRVGLALGGGVLRGLAHIGVLRALAEAGIRVDCLAGTSSGSLVGALYAGGMDWASMQELIGKVGWLDLASPCWPSGGFVTNQKMRSFIERQIGPVQFSGLRIPFAAVAGDANAGREVILREGSVAEAVRASTAIPGIFRPVEVEGRYLVDGVVVNNVPASVVRAMGADLVIAVDITQYSFAPGPIRSFPEAMMRAIDIMARQTVSASLEWADVVIRPQVSGLGGFSFKNAPEFIRRGYLAGKEAVPAILARLEELRLDYAQ